MCTQWWKNLWYKPPTVFTPSDKIFLTQAINDYPGTVNDLNECLADQDKLIKVMPEFQLRRFTDRMVNPDSFITRHLEAFADCGPNGIVISHYSGHGTQGACSTSLEPDGYREGFYLYGRVLWDKDFHDKVLTKIPTGKLGVFLIDPTIFNLDDAINNINSLPKYVNQIVIYIMIIVLVEWILRIALAIRYKISPKKEKAPPIEET